MTRHDSIGRVLAAQRRLDIAKYRGALAAIMQARAQMCQRKGFDAIDFDNVDGYAGLGPWRQPCR